VSAPTSTVGAGQVQCPTALVLSFCYETSVFALGHSSPAVSGDTLEEVQLDDAPLSGARFDASARYPGSSGAIGTHVGEAMIFARGHRASYAACEDAGAKGWNFDALVPYFKRTETAVGRDPALRGVDGPLIVRAADPLNELHAAGLAAAVQSGYRRASDISGGLEVGFGHVDLNIIDGQRQSAADAYLRPALNRPNLTLVIDAVVGRLVIEHGRCIGVEYRTGNGTLTAHARAAEVVLTAGAIGSAQLLMSSGIGPQSHLAEVGVDVELVVVTMIAAIQGAIQAAVLLVAAHTGCFVGGVKVNGRDRGSGVFARGSGRPSPRWPPTRADPRPHRWPSCRVKCIEAVQCTGHV
jgi:GMC oxidoreductase